MPHLQGAPASAGRLSSQEVIKTLWEKSAPTGEVLFWRERFGGTQAGLEGPRKAWEGETSAASTLCWEGQTKVSQTKAGTGAGGERAATPRSFV